MFILALDLATRVGWASGIAGNKPDSGSFRLRRPDDEAKVGWENLGKWLDALFKMRKPDLVIYERAMSPGAMQKVNPDGTIENLSKPATIEFLIGLVGSLHGVTGPHEIRTEAVVSASWRKHLLGTAKWPKGTVKAETIKRVHLLGLMPKESRDDNRADALGVWEYASSRYGRRAPAEFRLHGQ